MALTFERRFYTATALMTAAVVFIGFSQTFYLRLWFETPPLSVLRYAHGTVMTAWYGLFLAQVVLISRCRVDIHRRLGIVAAVTAVLVLVSGVTVGLAFVARSRGNPDDAAVAAVIAGYDFMSLVVFALLVGAALLFRKRSDYHKRLMTLASLSLLGPPLARLVGDEYALWATYVLVALPVAVDTWRHRRLHPAFGWGGALFLITSRIGVHFALSPEWINYALRVFP